MLNSFHHYSSTYGNMINNIGTHYSLLIWHIIIHIRMYVIPRDGVVFWDPATSNLCSVCWAREDDKRPCWEITRCRFNPTQDFSICFLVCMDNEYASCNLRMHKTRRFASLFCVKLYIAQPCRIHTTQLRWAVSFWYLFLKGMSHLNVTLSWDSQVVDCLAELRHILAKYCQFSCRDETQV